MKRFWFLFLLIITISSCKKDEYTSTPSNIFQVDFTNNFLCETCGEGIVFLSDMNGNVFAEKSWIGNDLVVFPRSDSIEIPSGNIIVTIVHKNEYERVYLNSYLDIPLGSKWTKTNYITTDFDNPIYEVEISFSNIPENEGYLLSTLWNRNYSSNPLNNFTEINFNVYASMYNLYFTLNTLNGSKNYIWLQHNEDSILNIDLNNLSSTSVAEIEFPGVSYGYSAYLYTYPIPGVHSSRRYTIDRNNSYDAQVSEISINYPGGLFNEYRTSIFYYDNEMRNDFWYRTIYGDIPNEFIKIDADFQFVEVSKENFEIETTGQYELNITRWEKRINDTWYRWYIYAPETKKQYALPNLSDLVVEKYPDLIADSLNLRYASIYDHIGLDNYVQVINLLFNANKYIWDEVLELRARTKYYDEYKKMDNGKQYEELDF